MSKEIITLLQVSGSHIIQGISNICLDSIQKTDTELMFFRDFFPELEKYLNGYKIDNKIQFRCRTKEIHQKPIIKYGQNLRCELGDYFINVKYIKNGICLGNRLVVYQLKYSHQRKWKIDPKQLEFLTNWPSFSFGKQGFGTNTFLLQNLSYDIGSYAFISKSSGHVAICSADVLKNRKYVSINELYGIFPYHISNAIFHQLIWRYGESINNGSIHKYFLDTLYRYVDFNVDPPDEFKNYCTKENNKKSFWGIEIIVNMNNY